VLQYPKKAFPPGTRQLIVPEALALNKNSFVTLCSRPYPKKLE